MSLSQNDTKKTAPGRVCPLVRNVEETTTDQNFSNYTLLVTFYEDDMLLFIIEY
jgi:hypothetical protein